MLVMNPATEMVAPSMRPVMEAMKANLASRHKYYSSLIKLNITLSYVSLKLPSPYLVPPVWCKPWWPTMLHS
jgi:hypothetical protein